MTTADKTACARSAPSADETCQRIGIFAGTTEGRLLCEHLSEAAVHADVFAATEYGASLVCDLPDIVAHAGRLDETEMAHALAGFTVIVDATHPYAVAASDNIRAAAERIGARYVRLLRPETAHPDNVVVVASPEEAAAFLVTVSGNILLTTGSKDLAAYTSIPDFEKRCFPRVLPETDVVRHCHEIGFPTSQLICMQGPFSRDLNVALLRAIHAAWMVTKDTGSAGGLDEKLAAAADAEARVVLIARPREESGLSLDEVVQLLVEGAD